MPDTPAVQIRSLTVADEPRWRELFHAYREFYQLQRDDDVVSRVWQWLTNDDHESRALVAEVDGEVVGIAHYRAFSRPITGTVGIWLDDLYTDAQARGAGAGRALVRRLQEIAAADGRSVVRWITADDNTVAQGLYDQIATRTRWVTYDAAPETS